MTRIKLKTGEELKIYGEYCGHIIPGEDKERLGWHYYQDWVSLYHIPKDNISYVVSDIKEEERQEDCPFTLADDMYNN